ncbi:MAG: NAD-dependent epimerase [Pseudomonadota bacterium]|nr:NAD-dependent epimerase [Burkholderiales bacterium]MDQ3197031.1 NAD-dependent epimerase [Pseudomonadota bacterium]
MKVLVTGCAGFVGMHVSQCLLDRGDEVVGIDNLNDYYDPSLKLARLAMIQEQPRFTFHKIDISDSRAILDLFASERIDRVVHLAAQAGVRYSLTNPQAYVDSNVTGFLSILEACRHHRCGHLVYASSSSVYGANRKLPFSVHDNVDHPVSLYAATKKCNELMAHTYSHLFGLPVTGLRFFTVYGPWGRPDMSLALFARAILEGRPIDVFNHGEMERDFTYIDDIVQGVVRLLDVVPAANPGFDLTKPDPSASNAPYRLYNIGNNRPVKLLTFIETIERALGRSAIKNLLPMQPGDVPSTAADIEDLRITTGFSPSTALQDGIANYAAWFRNYYKM